MPESIRANVAGEGSFARVSGEVIPEMFPRLEFLAALQAIEVTDVVMLGPDVGLEPARLAEAFVAVLATDLSADSVSSEMVAERVPVGVALVAHVALGRLTFVGILVNPGRRSVVETGRTPITKISSVKVVVVVAAVQRAAGGSLCDVRSHRISRNVKPQVSSQILTIGKTLQTSQTNQSLGLVGEAFGQ